MPVYTYTTLDDPVPNCGFEITGVYLNLVVAQAVRFGGAGFT